MYCVAVLAAGAPELAPFMADECLLAMPDMEGIDYTMKEYMKLVEKTRECVERLNSQGDLFCVFNYKLKALEKDPAHGWIPQSRQSARLSLQSSELAPIARRPHTRLRVRERGEPMRTKGQTLRYSTYNLGTLISVRYGTYVP